MVKLEIECQAWSVLEVEKSIFREESYAPCSSCFCIWARTYRLILEDENNHRSCRPENMPFKTLTASKVHILQVLLSLHTSTCKENIKVQHLTPIFFLYTNMAFMMHMNSIHREKDREKAVIIGRWWLV